MEASSQNTGRLPSRRTSHLRTGRISLPGARYFVTAVTQDRAPALADPVVAQQVCKTLFTLHETGDIYLLASSVMPEHVHLLFELGERLSVGRVCAKFKTLARDQGRAKWCWQQDQFEHRLRPRETIENYGLYTFLNPYRAGLVGLESRWPWWLCPSSANFAFMRLLRKGDLPQPEWLGLCESLERALFVGE